MKFCLKVDICIYFFHEIMPHLAHSSPLPFDQNGMTSLGRNLHMIQCMTSSTEAMDESCGAHQACWRDVRFDMMSHQKHGATQGGDARPNAIKTGGSAMSSHITQTWTFKRSMLVLFLMASLCGTLFIGSMAALTYMGVTSGERMEPWERHMLLPPDQFESMAHGQRVDRASVTCNHSDISWQFHSRCEYSTSQGYFIAVTIDHVSSLIGRPDIARENYVKSRLMNFFHSETQCLASSYRIQRAKPPCSCGDLTQMWIARTPQGDVLGHMVVLHVGEYAYSVRVTGGPELLSGLREVLKTRTREITQHLIE